MIFLEKLVILTFDIYRNFITKTAWKNYMFLYHIHVHIIPDGSGVQTMVSGRAIDIFKT